MPAAAGWEFRRPEIEVVDPLSLQVSFLDHQVDDERKVIVNPRLRIEHHVDGAQA